MARAGLYRVGSCGYLNNTPVTSLSQTQQEISSKTRWSQSGSVRNLRKVQRGLKWIRTWDCLLKFQEYCSLGVWCVCSFQLWWKIIFFFRVKIRTLRAEEEVGCSCSASDWYFDIEVREDAVLWCSEWWCGKTRKGREVVPSCLVLDSGHSTPQQAQLWWWW